MSNVRVEITGPTAMDIKVTDADTGERIKGVHTLDLHSSIHELTTLKLTTYYPIVEAVVGEDAVIVECTELGDESVRWERAKKPEEPKREGKNDNKNFD